MKRDVKKLVLQIIIDNLPIIATPRRKMQKKATKNGLVTVLASLSDSQSSSGHVVFDRKSVVEPTIGVPTWLGY
jgi:hypothetical protein